MGERFVFEDGWLLTSICRSRGGRCDRERLNGVGDMFNHAIFLDSEVEDGMRRLTAAGYARRDGDEFVVTDAGRKFVKSHGKFWRRGHIVAMFAVCDALIATTPR